MKDAGLILSAGGFTAAQVKDKVKDESANEMKDIHSTKQNTDQGGERNDISNN